MRNCPKNSYRSFLKLLKGSTLLPTFQIQVSARTQVSAGISFSKNGIDYFYATNVYSNVEFYSGFSEVLDLRERGGYGRTGSTEGGAVYNLKGERE